MRPASAGARLPSRHSRRCLPPPRCIGSLPPRLMAPPSRAFASENPNLHHPSRPQQPDARKRRAGFLRDLAMRITEMGAKQLNDPWAKLNYAMTLLETGRNSEAVHYLQQAAAADNSEAMLFLGELHREGALVPRDMKTALKYYEKAAQKGSLPAIRYLGLDAYSKGVDGVIDKDEDKAALMLEAGAALGDPPCMTEWGMKMLSGEGVKRDEAKALAYLEAAAAKGQDEAALALALYYRERMQDGDGVQCVHYAGIAAETNPKAAMLMVELHLEGKLMKRNLEAAIEHAKFASGFEGEDGEAAQQWLIVMEKKLGRKLLPEDNEASARKEEAKEIWMEQSAIEEERMRRAATNKEGKTSSKK